MGKSPEITLSELAEKLGGDLEGDGNVPVRGVAPLKSALGDQVGFLANSRYEKHMSTSSAAAVIVQRDYRGPRAENCALIRCEDAYFAFREAMVIFHGFRKPEFEGIDERVAVDPSVELARNVTVGAFAIISRGSQIGSDTVIYPGVYVGPNCKIGSGCLIYPNVVLYEGTILHDRVTIHANSSIGHDGFGYATHKGADGVVRHEKIPQSGWVEIEDDVEIGACCTIDRATMGATIIGAGTKFSNLIAIGHGTQMGKHCLMVAQAGIAGSVMVGDYCSFAGQCGVVGHIRIGDGARIGAKAGVINDVERGQEVLGSPAIPRTEAKRALVNVSQLPKLRDTVRKLKEDLRALRRKLGLKSDRQIPGGESEDAET